MIQEIEITLRLTASADTQLSKESIKKIIESNLIGKICDWDHDDDLRLEGHKLELLRFKEEAEIYGNDESEIKDHYEHNRRANFFKEG